MPADWPTHLLLFGLGVVAGAALLGFLMRARGSRAARPPERPLAAREQSAPEVRVRPPRVPETYYLWMNLTEREKQVAHLVGKQMTNAEIARELVISRYTVEAHVRHIYRKLKVNSRNKLARIVEYVESQGEGPG